MEQLTAKYCYTCSKLLSADKYHCPTCYSEDLEVKNLSGKGEVYSYTNIFIAPKQFADKTPYYIILVDLVEGLRVTARYNGENVKIGEKVEFENIEDRALYFKPA